MPAQTHRDLMIWQKGLVIANTIYSVTKSFPKSEIFGLVSQMQRAAVSVPTNIAEGYARNSKKEFAYFFADRTRLVSRTGYTTGHREQARVY